MDVKQQLRGFIMKNFVTAEKNLDDDTPLIEKGIVDSFGFLEVLTFIEKNFGVKIDDDAFQKGLGDSISSLAEYIRTNKKD